MLTNQEINEIASLPETAFRFKVHVDALMEFYQWIREQWTAKSLAEHKAKYNLDCRTTEGKLRCAWYAAKELSIHSLPPSSERVSEPQTNPIKEVQISRILCQTIALLPPVPKTNGLEKAPAYQILGEPIYFDELVRNYRQLVVKWHPDYNSSVEAVGRIQLITSIYQELKAEWFTKYSPLIPLEKIGKENHHRAMSKQFPWIPESFWR